VFVVAEVMVEIIGGVVVLVEVVVELLVRADDDVVVELGEWCIKPGIK
jgi:hypothetical protein